MSTPRKTERIIRLFILIPAFAGGLVLSASAQSVLTMHVTIECTDMPLAQMLNEITRQYHVPFSYFSNRLPLQKKITLRVQDEPLGEVLEQVSKLAGIQYQAIGGQIVLKEGSAAPHLPGPANENPGAARNAYPLAPSDIHHRLLTSAHPLSGPTTGPFPAGISRTRPGGQTSGKRPATENSEASTIQQPLTRPEKTRLSALPYVRIPYRPAELPLAVPALLPPPASLPPPVKPVYTPGTFQVALVPGISTQGIHPGEYVNALSVNLFAGYSAGNRILEIGGLSNFTQRDVSGLQIGGLANVVGGNRFVGLSAPEKQKLKAENAESTLQGVQVAGLTNIIDGKVSGWQTAGGINVVKKSLQGVQLAGISNLVTTYSFGLQLAGISNASLESMDGIQVAALYNYTQGELHGLQLSAFNQAGEIEGKHSLMSVSHTGWQIGLLNTARRMNGFQFGLINIGGAMAGTQVGLINLNGSRHGNGLPIGLLNLNSRNEFLRVYTSELFASNVELSTGSLRVQNIISVGYNPVTGREFYRPKWSLGYSIGQIKRPGKAFFYSYDAGLSHLFPDGKLTRQLSLLTRVRATAGHRVRLRKLDFHVFGGLTFNTYFTGAERRPVAPEFFRIYHKATDRSGMEMWPGLVAGFHL